MEAGSRAPPPHLDRGERCSVRLQRLALLLLERVELHEALGHCRPARAAAGSSMVVMRSWVHIADVCRMVWCGMTAEDSMRHERANGRRCGVQRGYCPGPQTSRESGQPAARPHEMWNDSCMKSLAAWFYMGELAPGNSSGSPPAPSLSSGGAWNTVHAPEEEATGLPLWLIPLFSAPKLHPAHLPAPRSRLLCKCVPYSASHPLCVPLRRPGRDADQHAPLVIRADAVTDDLGALQVGRAVKHLDRIRGALHTRMHACSKV